MTGEGNKERQGAAAQKAEQEEHQLSDYTIIKKKIYTNRQAVRIESEKKMMDISNEMLRNGIPTTRTPINR